MMPDPTLFHGIAVLIDDDISKPDSGIRTMQAQIEAAGCHVVQMGQLPGDDSVLNLRGMSFCVLDWNLYGNALREAAGGEEVPATPMLKKQNADAAIAFLKKLKKVCVAPVFIFTDEACGCCRRSSPRGGSAPCISASDADLIDFAAVSTS